MVTLPGTLMTTSSNWPGSFPVLQFDAVPQSPPAGLTQVTTDGSAGPEGPPPSVGAAPAFTTRVRWVPSYTGSRNRPPPSAGRLLTAKSPDREAKTNTWKLAPRAGLNPLTSFTARVPPSVAAPVTLSWSYCVPGV